MNFNELLALIDGMPEYRLLLDELRQSKGDSKTTVLEAAKPFVIAALYRDLKLPVLVVTSQPENARNLYDQLTVWCNSAVKLLPEPDALPYQRVASDASTELERLQVLSSLAGQNGVPLVIISAPALMQKTASYKDFSSAIHTITLHMNTEPSRLLSRWDAMGYRMESIVEVPGTMSHRGGIVDIFPPTSEFPVRIEFFGNTIDSIRLFDPATQRSKNAVESITIVPATELLAPLAGNRQDVASVLNSLDLSGLNPEARRQYQQEMAMLVERQRPHNIQFYAPLFNTDSLLSYLPPEALIIWDEPQSIKSAVEDFESEAEELRQTRLEQGELPANFPVPYFPVAELEEKLQNRQRLIFSSWDTDDSQHKLNFTPAPRYAGQLPVFIDKVKQLLGQGQRIILASQQSSRLSELLDEEDVIAPTLAEIKQLPSPCSVIVAQGSLAEGWVMSDDTYFFTDTEIFGFAKERRLVRKRAVARHKLFAELTPGSYVVHIEHGIAKFSGVITQKTASGEKEYLVLKYAAGDKLLVPVDQLDRVDRYIGATEKPPHLSRLGTQEWLRTRQKTKEAAEAVALELLSLYAAREAHHGFAYSPDTVWQQELEASFPYVETPDQITVQGEVKADMEKSKPMDRLVCGDVGYGKTEVALRAAFKAVMDSKQVAILVPTTVLAEQHYATFSQRLSAFPVRVEVLSRFRKPKEQKVILEGLAGGSVDICIGTHRLLQKDVHFKDLGLLIIDEEQRFGVAHKEHLKKMREEVDVLTLSATPIPRTLHMSLAGVRDMSVMETPPEDRLPVKTYVAEYDDRLVREAILRELERNGQVFFVHNRVQGIAFLAQKIQMLVPEAKVTFAHGRMKEDELAEVMAGFSHVKSNVLVCTTIIESGLDMPRVNTLIINRADRFGLTQLYQLRGRVGRGSSLAYAYLLYDKEGRLTPTARKRLNTIYEATELGAGFGIAMKDLEIRGAGTLLGMNQSGFISAVGFSMYTRLLADAVEEIKNRQAGIEKAKVPKLPPPSIDLPLPAYIPEDYISDLDTRLDLYLRMAKVDAAEQVDVLGQEFKDRFGTLPMEVESLLYTVKLKALGAKAGIESISTHDHQIVLRRFEGMRFDKQKLEPCMKEGVKVDSLQVSLSSRRGHWRELLESVLRRV